MGVRDDGEELAEGANRGGPGDKEQFVEQLDGVIEAEASRADAAGDGALQLQATVAHAAGHADGARHGQQPGEETVLFDLLPLDQKLLKSAIHHQQFTKTEQMANDLTSNCKCGN